MREKRFGDLSAAALHILAMVLMLCDHLWATVVPGNDWLTCIGRIAYPIFAFMIAEGYFRTGNLRRYMGRLLVFALLSEIPFNLMYSSSVVYPYHQNVLWTFLIALCLMVAIDRVKRKGKLWLTISVSALCLLAGYLLGFLTMVDYYGIGVLTVLVFYFFRGRTWWHFAAQLVALYYLNVVMLGGLYYDVTLFGVEFELVQQGLALLALIPIWLYKGRQGYHSRAFQYFCYGFYPAHMLLLALIHMYG